MPYLGSLIFTLYFWLSTLLWSVVVALLIVVPYRIRFAAVALWARALLALLRVFCGLSFTVEGKHNFPDEPVVIMQKHSSAWETAAGTLYCPPHTWVIKRELMWIPMVGIALRAMRVIPINRKGHRSAINQVVSKGSQRLGDGVNVMIYPEGTRVEGQRNGRFGRSGSILATSAGVPVIPIAHNAGEFWGRNRLLKRAGTVRVVIGEPIATAGRSAQDVNRDAARWMDETMERISNVSAPPAGLGQSS